MKTLALALGLVLVSANVFAADKVCFGKKNDADAMNTSFNAAITEAKVAVTNTKGAEWDGDYPRSKAPSVNGKDGKVYLNYDIPNANDGCDTVLVDEALLQAGGKGLLNFRCRGEGFSDTTYFCRDGK